jgi:subtilisin family serine protease
MHSTFFTSDSAYLGGAFLAGTSFAAPHVTGALALALTKYPNEPHTRTISRVLVATEPLPALAGRCRTGGRLNLSRILNPPIELAIVNAGGGRRIEGRTSPGRVCVIEASENLSSWSAIGARVSSEDGRFQFLDFGPGVQTRFYRAAASP